MLSNLVAHIVGRILFKMQCLVQYLVKYYHMVYILLNKVVLYCLPLTDTVCVGTGTMAVFKTTQVEPVKSLSLSQNQSSQRGKKQRNKQNKKPQNKNKNCPYSLLHPVVLQVFKVRMNYDVTSIYIFTRYITLDLEKSECDRNKKTILICLNVITRKEVYQKLKKQEVRSYYESMISFHSCAQTYMSKLR